MRRAKSILASLVRIGSRLGPFKTVTAAFLGLFGFASLVQADATGSSRFLGTLFWPNFQLKVSPSVLTSQVTNTPRGPHGTMNLLPDNHPIRVFASNVFNNQQSSLTPMAQLGQDLFFDTSLSNPPGQACASCHSPQAGFTFPNSNINATQAIAPGAVPGRVGNRLPPSVTYAKFSPPGPVYDPSLTAYAGGLFWDGRTSNLTTQPPFPLFNPNEMNNIIHNVADPSLVVSKVENGPYAKLYQSVFGENAFSQTTQLNMTWIAQAISTYESTTQVSPFSSKYDAYLKGQATLTASEMRGLRLFTGSVTGRPGGPANYKAAQCVLCHGIPSNPSTGPDIFSNFCYANIGVPKNPQNPYYRETNSASDPLGYNPLGANYIDLGLGDFLYPASGLPSGNMGTGNNGQGDYLQINGTFKAPSLRNLNKRPYPGFVRAYMHNGVFKSLKEVVHFYNTRNLTTVKGEVIDFTQPNPYAGLKGTPLFPPPEYPSPVTLQNPQGGPGNASNQVGNLGLTSAEEDDLVAFLKTLTDN
jgi:cytochrome c peroxidase